MRVECAPERCLVRREDEQVRLVIFDASGSSIELQLTDLPQIEDLIVCAVQAEIELRELES